MDSSHHPGSVLYVVTHSSNHRHYHTNILFFHHASFLSLSLSLTHTSLSCSHTKVRTNTCLSHTTPKHALSLFLSLCPASTLSFSSLQFTLLSLSFSLSLWQRHKQTSTVQNWELWCRYKLSGLMQFWVFHFKTLKPFIIFWVLLLLLCSYHQNKIIMICCLCDSAISCVGSKFRITNAFDVTLGNIEIWKK